MSVADWRLDLSRTSVERWRVQSEDWNLPMKYGDNCPLGQKSQLVLQPKVTCYELSGTGSSSEDRVQRTVTGWRFSWRTKSWKTV